MQNRLAPSPLQILIATNRLSPRTGIRSKRGFTLVEMLVVLGIMAIMIGIAVVALPGIKGAADTTKAAYDIAGVLEYARTQAMAGSTYTWVGFFEEDPTKASGTAGTGQLVIAIVSSRDGTNLNPTGTPPAKLPVASLVQLNKLVKIPNLHLTALQLADTTTRPTYPLGTVTTNQLSDPGGTIFQNTPKFDYPLTGTVQYTFSNIIQFNPQGDASVVDGSPTQLFEIGLQPARGNVAIASKNLVALQIEGIGGKVTTYRP